MNRNGLAGSPEATQRALLVAVQTCICYPGCAVRNNALARVVTGNAKPSLTLLRAALVLMSVPVPHVPSFLCFAHALLAALSPFISPYCLAYIS